MDSLYKLGINIFDEFGIFLKELLPILEQLPTEILSNQKCHLPTGKYISSALNISGYIRYVHKITVEINQVTINYEFWDKNKNKDASKYFIYGCFAILYFSKINPGKRTLKLSLINCPDKKKTPINTIFTPEHVNSGVTISDGIDGEIWVYRKEEMYKVLVHEIIHFLNIDSKEHLNEDIFISKFCAFKSLNINETFTDSIACLFNIIMYTILTKPKNFKKDLLLNFKVEREFIKGQSRRVLDIVKFTTLNKCQDNPNLEETHAIAYYVLKAVLLDNLELYFEYLNNNNLMLRNSGDFIILLNKLIDNIKWPQFGKKEFLKIQKVNTMKMSSLEINNLVQYEKYIKLNQKK